VHETLSASHDPRLVLLSYLLAALASYAALDLVARAWVARGRARTAWLGAGAVAMGIGIWGMHFMGMLAFRPHAAHGGALRVGYDVPLVALSIVVAVVASALALRAGVRDSLRVRELLGAGTLMAAAIAGMHYIGMAAMHMAATVRYDARLVLLSLAIAFAASVAALWIARRLREAVARREVWAKRGAACVMGVAIVGMHYTGMAAVRLSPAEAPAWGRSVLATDGLAVATLVAALSVIGLALAGSAMDERHQARIREATRRSEERYRAVLESLQDIVFEIDGDLRWTFLSPAWTAITGRPAATAIGRPALDAVMPDDRPAVAAALAALLAGDAAEWRESLRFDRGDGGELWLEVRARATPDALGRRRGVFGLLTDITARKALEAQLSYQAYHDPLTALANRALFRDRVTHAVARERRHGDAIAVLFLDLDDFKAVNDGLGHAAGDQLLVTVAERLLSATRGSDTVARLGGDEFAVLLEHVHDEADARVVTERIVKALAQPIEIGAQSVRVAASIGVAHPHGGDGAEELLRNADVAMYRAKRTGRGAYEVYSPAMRDAGVDRLALESDLRRAIDEDELLLVYQPVVELGSGRVTGVEALVRWQHPTRGLLGPAAFIPFAEESGLIVPLGRWVIATACRQVAEWRDGRLALAWDGTSGAHPPVGGDEPPTVSINVSGRQLHDAGLAACVGEALAASGLPASAVILEITETVIMKDAGLSRARLHALKALGVRLAIDDFGTGYSSLGYLQQFPVDVLKIDKRFIDGVARGGVDAALARTILALGESLSLRCVAEGIETEEQHRHLVEMGCAFGQGYLFSRPVRPRAAERAAAAA